MSQSSLEDYIKRMGEHINLIYKRLEEIEGKINAVSGVVNELKVATETNNTNIVNLRESTVSRLDFDNFVKKLTESFKEFIPSVPEPKST